MNINKSYVAYAAMVLWSVFLCLALGKDLNWDFINYHFYSPYLLLDNRLEKDYFAANFQGYLNPLVDVPLYLMIKWGLNDIFIAIIFSTIQSINLVLVWKITEKILPSDLNRRTGWLMLAVAFVAIAPLFGTLVGPSFNDATVSIFVLSSVWVLLLQSRSKLCLPLAAGCLLGIGAGLKLTMMLFSPALIVAAYLTGGDLRKRLLAIVVAGFGILVGFAVVHGYWSYHLFREFGNPVFPLYNEVFKSPDYTDENYMDKRMLVCGKWQSLCFPFLALSSRTYTYAENSIPDVRFLFVALLMAAMGVRWACTRFSHKYYSKIAKIRSPEDDAFRQVFVFFLVAYVCWATVSGIGRYGIALWFLMGALGVATGTRMLRPSLLRVLFGVVIGIQLIVQWFAGSPRWAPTAWSGAWMYVHVPASAVDTPRTYLSISVKSPSIIYPYMNRDSRFVTLIGQNPIKVGSQMPDKIKKFLEIPDEQLRLIIGGSPENRPKEGKFSEDSGVNALISGYGFRLSGGKCEEASVRAFSHSEGFLRVSSEGGRELIVEKYRLCPIQRLDADSVHAIEADYRAAEDVFSSIEKKCHDMFSPTGMEVVRGPGVWVKSYTNTNNLLKITSDRQVQTYQYGKMMDQFIGKADDWLMHPETMQCPMHVD